MDGTKLKFTNEQAKSAIRAIIACIAGATPRLVDDRITGFDLPIVGTNGTPGAYIAYDEYKHRWTISGRWPHSTIPRDNQMFHPGISLHPVPADTEISISATKTPGQVAAEITRRFWPDYFVVWTACNARRIQHEDFLRDRTDLAATLATALAVSVPALDPNREPVLDLPGNIRTGEESAYGDITVNSGTRVQVNIRSLAADKALKLIEFLKTL